MENPDITWYADVDGDGFETANKIHSVKENRQRDVSDNTDCDDADASEYPEVGIRTMIWMIMEIQT